MVCYRQSNSKRYSQSKSIKFYFSNAFILVTGDITVTANNDTDNVAFENCSSLDRK